MKSQQGQYFLLILLQVVSAGGVAAQTADNSRITPACQVERVATTDSSPTPGGSFSFSIGGFPFGGGGSQRSSSGEREAYGRSDSSSESDYSPSEETGRAPDKDRGSRGNVGVGLSFDLGELFRHLGKSQVPERLFEDGPQFENAFSMACIPVRGFVRGGWPLVIDYQAEPGTLATLEIHVEGREPVVLPLRGGSEHNLLKLQLPAQLGDKLSPALFLVRAVKDQPGAPELGRINVFGLGAGPRAVGSVAIDQVDFTPGTVSLGKKQSARFSFYSRSDFNRVSAEVLRVVNRDGDLQVQLARSIPLDGGVAAGTWVGRQEARTWDGTDANRQASLGQHLMQVRAWLSAQDGGDWVAAWSAWTVEVTR